jgi:catechol 2,3-dioxygenase-like lactoylglutathione lyase family enzyme
MGIQITKRAVDLGIVSNDGDKAVAFYRDVLGFEPEYSVPLPNGGVMHRMLCGDSIFKIMCPDEKSPPLTPTPEHAHFDDAQTVKGLVQRTCALPGIRFITIWVSNLQEIVDACKAFGSPIVHDVQESRPGVVICVLEDPDGNWIEFVDYTDSAAAKNDLSMKHDRLAGGDPTFVET